MADPLRLVVKPELHAGGSVLAGWLKHHWWELELDCGHQVERRIRYLPPVDGSRPRRGWAAQHHGPSVSRIPPPPKRARCEWCGRG